MTAQTYTSGDNNIVRITMDWWKWYVHVLNVPSASSYTVPCYTVCNQMVRYPGGGASHKINIHSARVAKQLTATADFRNI